MAYDEKTKGEEQLKNGIQKINNLTSSNFISKI
jgi:hypothetical protein